MHTSIQIRRTARHLLTLLCLTLLVGAAQHATAQTVYTWDGLDIGSASNGTVETKQELSITVPKLALINVSAPGSVAFDFTSSESADLFDNDIIAAPTAVTTTIQVLTNYPDLDVETSVTDIPAGVTLEVSPTGEENWVDVNGASFDFDPGYGTRTLKYRAILDMNTSQSEDVSKTLQVTFTVTENS